MTSIVAGTDRYLAEFESLERGADRAPAWLAALRREAMARFAERGFPTTHDEEWRFTNVAPIARNTFAPAPEAAAILLIRVLTPACSRLMKRRMLTSFWSLRS